MTHIQLVRTLWDKHFPKWTSQSHNVQKRCNCAHLSSSSTLGYWVI